MKRLLILLTACAFISNVHGQNIYDSPEVTFRDGVCCKGYSTDEFNILAHIKKQSKEFALSGNEIIFNFGIENNSGRNLDFNPALFKVYGYKKNKRIEIKLFSYDEYKAKCNNNIFWFGPNNTEQVKSETLIESGPHGKVKTKATTTTEVYTGARDSRYRDAEEYLADYLKRNTMNDKGIVKGFMVLDNYKGNIVELEVTLADTKFLFKFDIVKNE